jgi:hypothetical protein
MPCGWGENNRVQMIFCDYRCTQHMRGDKLADLDWMNIETEYITTSISQRTIAKKYGVSMRTLTDRAILGKWKQKRDDYRSKSVAKAVDMAIQNDANRIARILNISDTAISSIEEAIGELRKMLTTHSKKTKKVTLDKKTGKPIEEVTTEINDIVIVDGPIDTAKLYQITQALKNLKEIQMLRSDKDDKEQDARIKKLENDAAKANIGNVDEDNTGVMILPEIIEEEDTDSVDI